MTQDLELDNKKLREKVNTLTEELTTIKEKLKKYTNSDAKKRYYEKNKEQIIEKSKIQVDKLRKQNPEIQKKYSRDYHRRKKKLQDTEELVE
jgi:hypothetical protein